MFDAEDYQDIRDAVRRNRQLVERVDVMKPTLVRSIVT